MIMDNFLSHKKIWTSFSSTTLDNFVPSFVTTNDIHNNDSVLSYDPSSSTISDASDTIAEVPDSIVRTTSIAEKCDIIDLDIDGNAGLLLKKNCMCGCCTPKRFIAITCNSKLHTIILWCVIMVKLRIGKKIRGLQTMTLNCE